MTQINITEARELYENGWTFRELGVRYGVTGATMANHFRRAGIETRGTPHIIRGCTIEAIVQLYYGEKLSLTDVGEALDVSATKVQNELLRHGYRIRQRGEMYAYKMKLKKENNKPEVDESEVDESKGGDDNV